MTGITSLHIALLKSKIVFISVIATIKNARPDLLTDRPITADPIPTQMPQELVKSGVDNIVDIGEPTTACFFTLSSIDPKGWLVYLLSSSSQLY